MNRLNKELTPMRKLMDEGHVTMYQVSNATSIKPTTIYSVSVGDRSITKHISVLSNFFSCDPDLLLGKPGRYYLEAQDGSGMVSVTEQAYHDMMDKGLIKVEFNGHTIVRVLLKDIPELDQHYLNCVELLKSLTSDEIIKAEKMLETMFR